MMDQVARSCDTCNINLHYLRERANGVEYDVVKESAVFEDTYLYRDMTVWPCRSGKTAKLNRWM